MTTVYEALILGVVQGLTEFLPISSTAHLRLVPFYLGWSDPGAAFSAVIQLGTLVAVFFYFSGDIRRLGLAALTGLRQRDFNHSDDSRLAWSIIPGSVPIAVLGLGFKAVVEIQARSLELIAVALIALGALLALSERLGSQRRSMSELGFWHVQIIGLCQALALIPGCSRSGSTIMGGLFIGLERSAAARFSFILGLPAIGASGLLQFFSLLEAGLAGDGLVGLGVGVAAAAISGYLSIGFLLRLLARHRTDLFSFYRIALGGIILFGLR